MDVPASVYLVYLGIMQDKNIPSNKLIRQIYSLILQAIFFLCSFHNIVNFSHSWMIIPELFYVITSVWFMLMCEECMITYYKELKFSHNFALELEASWFHFISLWKIAGATYVERIIQSWNWSSARWSRLGDFVGLCIWVQLGYWRDSQVLNLHDKSHILGFLYLL